MLKQLAVTVVMVALAIGAVFFVWDREGEECAVCHRPLHQATSYLITTDGGEQVDVCCPRCGLHYQIGRDDIASVGVADFSTGTMIDPTRATFVEGSEVHLCCLTPEVQEDRSGSQYGLDWDRCLPSLVAFRSLHDALEFQSRNGGRLRNYAALLAEEKAGDSHSP